MTAPTKLPKADTMLSKKSALISEGPIESVIRYEPIIAMAIIARTEPLGRFSPFKGGD